MVLAFIGDIHSMYHVPDNFVLWTECVHKIRNYFMQDILYVDYRKESALYACGEYHAECKNCLSQCAP